MAEETTPTQEKVETPPVQEQPKPEVKTQEEITTEELDALNREIEEANKTLVSEDVAKVIKLEKEAAKKEAEKEFLVNQRVKDLEAEKDALVKAKEQSEKEAAEKLEALTKKVNSLVSSQAPVKNENPFNEPQPAQAPSDNLTKEQMDNIEEASMVEMFGKQILDRT